MRQGAGEHDFRRYSRRPACAECGAYFSGDRWKAVERVGWGVIPERHPSLCGACDRRFVTDVRQAWPARAGIKSRARSCPSRRLAAPGSPASAGEAAGPGYQRLALAVRLLAKDTK